MAGKLLVAGDSFGEFAGYHNHITTQDYAPPIRGNNWDKKFTHWCELLAHDLGYEAVNHSLGGSGVSTGSFLAMQQLHSNEYDLVVFFVSHQTRSLVNKAQRLAQWKDKISPFVMSDMDNNIVYDVEQYELFRHGQTHFRPENHGVEVKNVNAQDLYNLKEEPTCLDQHEISYLTYKPAYSYAHDSITAVLGLKQYCESHNIPIVFASCFAGSVCDAITNLGIEIKDFRFWECEIKYGFDVLDNWPGHYRDDHHALIYKEFKNLFPEIININNTNS